MSKEWQIDTRLLGTNGDHLKGCFDFDSQKICSDGKLRFSFIIRTEIGDVTYRGLRYDPDTNKLLLPSYRMKQGWQPYMKIEGELYEGLRDKAKQLLSELLEPLPDEQPQEVIS